MLNIFKQKASSLSIRLEQYLAGHPISNI